MIFNTKKSSKLNKTYNLSIKYTVNNYNNFSYYSNHKLNLRINRLCTRKFMFIRI